jgi:hypothetical protein
MDLAVGSYEQRRRLAQRMLSPAPGLDAAIAARLTQGKPQQRIHITTWLGKRAATQQVAAVRQALAGEKALPVRAALLSTLQQLGGDLSPYFDPDALRAEADEGLKKNPTDGLDWLRLDHLPACRQHNGQALDPVVLRWWVVLAAKLKQPGGNGMFDLYLQQLKLADAERLGLFLLLAWIDHDTRHPDEQACRGYAEQHIDATIETREWVKERIHSHEDIDSDKIGLERLP